MYVFAAYQREKYQTTFFGLTDNEKMKSVYIFFLFKNVVIIQKMKFIWRKSIMVRVFWIDYSGKMFISCGITTKIIKVSPTPLTISINSFYTHNYHLFNFILVFGLVSKFFFFLSQFMQKLRYNTAWQSKPQFGHSK